MLHVSLVTPTLNQGRFLRQTIESVLGQQGAFELDYRVIDGGSTDDTRSILESYRGQLTYTSQADHGQVDAINQGLAMTTGEVVGWLNSDDVLLPGALARVSEVFRQQPETEWVHGRCLIVDEAGREIQRWISWYKHRRCQRHSFTRLLLENYISQMTVYWRRGLLAEVGMLDRSLPLAFDYEMWLRLASRTMPVYITSPQAAFRRHPASKSAQDYDEMFRQELRAAERYGADHRRVVQSKRLRMKVFAQVYQVLDLGRGRRSRSGSSG